MDSLPDTDVAGFIEVKEGMDPHRSTYLKLSAVTAIRMKDQGACDVRVDGEWFNGLPKNYADLLFASLKALGYRASGEPE
jgi:hypothetical protein